MKTTCLNCSDQFDGHYCNNCGQAAHTGRLSLHSVWHEVEHALIHLDKGVLYTVKQLFTRPGHTIREYIEGRRVKHFKPLSLVIVLTTLQALLYHYFKVEMIPQNSPAGEQMRHSNGSVSLQDINTWLEEHMSLTTLIFMLFSTVASFLVFRKRGYNFVEFLFINAFIVCQHLIVQIVLFPATAMLNGSSASTVFSSFLSVLNVGLAIWVYMQFFNKESKVKIFFLSVLSYVISVMLLVIISVVVANIVSAMVKH